MMRRAGWTWLALLSLALCGPGCATLKTLATPGAEFNEKQKKRTAETLQAFEEQRNAAQFLAAQARWREGNTKACREALESLLVREPAHLEARLLLTQVLLSEQKFDVARGYLEQIIAERPADARAQHTMGLLCQMQGQDTEALAYYQHAAELEPDNEEYELSCKTLADRSTVRFADHQSSPGEPASSTPNEQAAQPASRPAATPEVERALDEADLALMDDDVPKARDLLTKAVSLEPDNPQVAIRAGVLALRHQHPELAVFVLRPVADRFTASAAFGRTLGMAYYRQGDYQAAQGALEQALSLDNSSALAYLLLGCTLEKLGHSEAARTHLEQARRLDPRLRLQP